MPLTTQERSWILYDVANSAFVLVVVTAVMPIHFKEIAAAGTPPHVSTAWWGYANSLSSFLLVLLSPVLGTLADFDRMKERFLRIFLIAGGTATALLSLSGPGTVLLTLSLFVIARTAWGGANIFYDALLPDVTIPARYDRISTLGYAWGYIGSVIPFLMVIVLLLATRSPGDPASIPETGSRWGFVIVALWWLVLSIPVMRDVRQSPSPPLRGTPVATAFRELAETFRRIREYRNPFLFLLAYFFFIDGIDTIITMAVAYGVDLGLGSTTLILVILTIQIVAFPCAVLWGRLSDRLLIKPLLMGGIGIYTLITLMAILLPHIPSLSSRRILFWVMAIMVATSMGGVQALSRSLFARLIPRSHAAEFFGFYNISGKFATVTGPALIGMATTLTGSSSLGIAAIIPLFLVGGIILHFVEDHG